MAYVADAEAHIWTAVDLVERFGALPLDRVRTNPAPGTATDQDVIDIHDRENRLCELVDGTLVEKTVGNYESYLALLLGHLLAGYVREHNLGIVLGADGMLRLAPGLVRIPDVSFLSWERLPGRSFPREPIWSLAPDLAIEVISRGNTPKEMQQKLHDYFAAGVRQVWYVYPATREVYVYAAPDQCTILALGQTLDGADVLPGLRLEVAALFTGPSPEGTR